MDCIFNTWSAANDLSVLRRGCIHSEVHNTRSLYLGNGVANMSRQIYF